MSRARRPSVSIHDYPEHLNPFNEESPNSQPQNHREAKNKDSKHKFWTFGRSRKKRSNSFSLKSTWSGLFGKRREVPDAQEKRSTITTVSSTYKNEPFVRPVVPPRISKDQQEFDEALGTLARRRKYTLDNSSKYSSSLTVNGDPARIYDGSPQDTTTSIMGDLTPRPPARRFGQVSPKPTDRIPSLDYEDREPKENESVTLREKAEQQTPVPPSRRFGNRSSQRLNASTLDAEEDAANRSCDLTLHDENENVPEDYVFKRFTQDAVRRSNMSINSCVSVTSTISSYGRKKRRAPQPPCRKEKLETAQENDAQNTSEDPGMQLQITEPTDIARVTENIDELTKRSKELTAETNENQGLSSEPSASESQSNPVKDSQETEIGKNTEDLPSKDVSQENVENVVTKNAAIVREPREKCEENTSITEETVSKNSLTEDQDPAKISSDETESKVKEVSIEYRRRSQDNLEIIKDVDVVHSSSELEDVCLRRKSSSTALSRSDSFSVKEEIEKIEKQIKALESNSVSQESSDDMINDIKANGRQSIQVNRRHFFQDMVDREGDKGVKIGFKELPREQKDIRLVRLTDPPVPVASPRDPVKVIELHISEPIRQKPEILDDVNPIPKPRRHSALNLNGSHDRVNSEEDQKVSEPPDKRGKSF